MRPIKYEALISSLYVYIQGPLPHRYMAPYFPVWPLNPLLDHPMRGTATLELKR